MGGPPQGGGRSRRAERQDHSRGSLPTIKPPSCRLAHSSAPPRYPGADSTLTVGLIFGVRFSRHTLTTYWFASVLRASRRTRDVATANPSPHTEFCRCFRGKSRGPRQPAVADGIEG